MQRLLLDYSQLEVLGRGNDLAGEIAGVEGRRDDDISVDNLLCHLAVGALLVVGDLRTYLSHCEPDEKK